MVSGQYSFAVIGGDKRQLCCARSLSGDGHKVLLGGFDIALRYNNTGILSPVEAASQSDMIILPLPSVDCAGRIPAMLGTGIEISDELLGAIRGKRVFCGFKDRLTASAPDIDCKLYDYCEREDFTVANAIVTAEGAVGIALREYEGTINGSNCLVCGFGRIGKALCRILKSLGATVTVSAEVASDMEWIRFCGARAVPTAELSKEGDFDIIFGTVPAVILDGDLLKRIAMHALVIDLASGDGSTDHRAAESLGIKAIHALSLPGKTAPKTAGEILKKTIYRIIEEDDR